MVDALAYRAATNLASVSVYWISSCSLCLSNRGWASIEPYTSGQVVCWYLMIGLLPHGPWLLSVGRSVSLIGC